MSDTTAEIGHLERRELQAPIAACLIRAFTEEAGRERALKVAAQAVQRDADKEGRALAERMDGNDLTLLTRVVREVWAQGGALTVRFLEESEHRLSFDVTRCRYAEMYERLGMKDLGHCLSCSRDEAFVGGFNPEITFGRTGTIMQGATACDFRFRLE